MSVLAGRKFICDSCAGEAWLGGVDAGDDDSSVPDGWMFGTLPDGSAYHLHDKCRYQGEKYQEQYAAWLKEYLSNAELFRKCAAAYDLATSDKERAEAMRPYQEWVEKHPMPVPAWRSS